MRKYSNTIELFIKPESKGGELITSTSDRGNKKSKKDFKELRQQLLPIMIAQIIIILLLVLNLVFIGFNLFSEGAVIDAGEGIKLEVESTVENVTQYNVKLKLGNTGDTIAKVNVAGETYVSKMGTAWGEEIWTVIDNKYVEIDPGESLTLNLGSLKTYEGWHYVVKVHVSWNGGSLELTDILIP